MSTLKIRLRNIFLGVLSCLLVLGLYSPAFSHLVGTSPSLWASEVSEFSMGMELDSNLQSAESTLLAQGMPVNSIKTYMAMMSDENVVPIRPTTDAKGVVGAALSGNRLIVRGSFRNLSSPMRDYAMDPVDPPNPNITSAFHIHQGMPTENGPFQYALTVVMDETGMGGSAMGDFTLTPDQLTALDNGMLYVDLHTTANRGGELRAILMPL